MFFSILENCPITKEKVSFRSIKHSVDKFINIKIALHKFDVQEITEEDGKGIYPPGSGIPFINYFDDTGLLNSIEELNKIKNKNME